MQNKNKKVIKNHILFILLYLFLYKFLSVLIISGYDKLYKCKFYF